MISTSSYRKMLKVIQVIMCLHIFAITISECDNSDRRIANSDGYILDPTSNINATQPI